MISLSKKNIKAVAPVIGFLLLIAIVFLALGQYQLNVVPENERLEESQHHEEVIQDFSAIRSSIIQSSTTNNVVTTNLQTGVTYDTLGLTQLPNPGQLSYTDYDAEIEIRNAENNQEASNFWRGDVNRTYETGYLEYNIGYNRMQDYMDLFYSHGFTYGDFARGSDEEIDFFEISDQPIINERSITLYTITATDLTESTRGQTTLEIDPVSAPMNSITVENFGDRPIELKIPTRLKVEDWEMILEDEIADNEDNENAYVTDIRNASDTDNAIVIELEEDETYNLEMSKVELTTEENSPRAQLAEKEYIAVGTQTTSIREGSSETLEAQIRDKYNNGVMGEEVFVEAQEVGTERCIGDFSEGDRQEGTTCNNEQGDYRQPGVSLTDSEGYATFIYQAPEIEGDLDVSFTYQFKEDE